MTNKTSNPTSSKTFDKPLPKRRTFLGKFRTYFLTGLVVVGPIAITLWVLNWIVGFLDRLIPKFLRLENYLTFIDKDYIPGTGLLAGIALIFIIGAITTNFLGRSILLMGERALSQMPFAGTIFRALRQIFKVITNSDKRSFSKAVLVEYPRKGLWAIAFLTIEAEESFNNIIGEESVCVFLPTTPNPTSGFLLFVPKNSIKPINLNVEAAARLVISAGIAKDDEEEGQSGITKDDE